jgi:thermitase
LGDRVSQLPASDNVGVTRVEIRAGNTLICADVTAPYSCTRKVPPNPKGATYDLQATAFDAAGNAQASPFVTVVTN